MDIFILLLIGFQLILGLMTLPVSIYHYDGSSILLLSEWAQRIVTFRTGAADLISEVNFLFKLHLFLASPCFWFFLSAVWFTSGACR